MPWKPGDAQKHTKKADTEYKQRVWAEVANAARIRTGDDAAAIKEANSAVKKIHQGQ